MPTAEHGTEDIDGTRIWMDRNFVDGWIRDDRGNLLELPRQVAAALVAQERPTATLIVDVASGPGAFLAAFLDRFPEAHGVWSDLSAAAGLLAPGGWLVNLDHVGTVGEWDRRLREVRRQFTPSRGDRPRHRDDAPLATVEDHLACYASAGIDDVAVVWRAFHTCLFMGRVTRASDAGASGVEQEVR